MQEITVIEGLLLVLGLSENVLKGTKSLVKSPE